MLCYVMLCYAMLSYAMLCYAMLCYAMLCYAMLCYGMLCYAMLCYAMLCYDMLCYVMLCYAMLCYALLCYGMLCYAMLCYAMLRKQSSSRYPFIFPWTCWSVVWMRHVNILTFLFQANNINLPVTLSRPITLSCSAKHTYDIIVLAAYLTTHAIQLLLSQRAFCKSVTQDPFFCLQRHQIAVSKINAL